MVETAKWHVRSNGLNFVIMDQDCNVVAEVKDEKHAHLIASTPDKDRKWLKAMAETVQEKVRADDATDWLDLMRDEFMRIKALTDNTEILGLCDRAVTHIQQHVPVIGQRDAAQRRVAKLEVTLCDIRDKTGVCSDAFPPVGKLIKAPAICNKCHFRFVNPTTGLVDSVCYKCGSHVVSEFDPRVK